MDDDDVVCSSALLAPCVWDLHFPARLCNSSVALLPRTALLLV